MVAGLATCATSASAEVPEKFTNLRVLPKTVSRKDLVWTMRGWASALGVRCDYCHSGGNPETLEGVDFASDAKREKRTARAMFRMVRALNAGYLAKLEPRPAEEKGGSPPVRVECVTCHRGLSRPETIDNVLARVLAKDGAAAAVQTYKDLHSKHLSTGRYDFSQGPLNKLGERLLGEERGRDALSFLELNAENYPTGPWVLFLLGEARLATGDRAGALEAFERTLALSPQDARARKRVDELKPAAPPSSPAPIP
jgi:tetratricopeptide (TPR) repeat protein